MSSVENIQSKERALAILAFHKIGKPPNGEYPTWNYIPEDVFLAFLFNLNENGWQVIDLATFLRGIIKPYTLPDRSALLTFDDGYQSILTVALPLLHRFQYPAVVFVPTDFIGGRNTFDDGIEPEEAICNWSELMELEKNGISIQSHGATHRHFSKLDLKEQKEELVRSKLQLEAKLGKPVEVFAYPYGDAGVNFQETRKTLIQTGYRAAFLYGGVVNTLSVRDSYRLHRLAMGPDTDLQTELLQCNFEP
jgi:peptidoglycan/xylan/chitin deacetylase (PgdA/CDA1 family)